MVKLIFHIKCILIYEVCVTLSAIKSISGQAPLQVELNWDGVPSPIDLQTFQDFSKCPPMPDGIAIAQRQIEQIYTELPWPSRINKVAVFTDVCGGRGDISAAAKVIGLMQRMDSSLQFYWMVSAYANLVPGFLTGLDASKIRIQDGPCVPTGKPFQADILINGPVKPSFGTKYIESRYDFKLNGPRFNFLENASDPNSQIAVYIVHKIANESTDSLKVFEKVYDYLFPAESGQSGGIIMGLCPGTGIFLDDSRSCASMSRGDCCPSYLVELEDEPLKRDLMQAVPDYDSHSLNMGYAHYTYSRMHFIDFVCIQERKKDVTVVLNQKGYSYEVSTQQFHEEGFDQRRLSRLAQWGYQRVIVKGAEETVYSSTTALKEGRTLTVILRPSFMPSDMRRLQLASERMLATGDNSAAEAWAARCKLYVYEDVHNGGCKKRFLMQQIALANKIFPEIGELLNLFGAKRSSDDLSEEEMKRAEEILLNPELPAKTLELCNTITQNYSFQSILKGALKRAAWHHVLPELEHIERAGIDPVNREELIDFFRTPESGPRAQKLHNLEPLSAHIHQAVLTHNTTV